MIISIAYTYNDQGYRISKSITHYDYTEQEDDIYNSGTIQGTALVPNTQNVFDSYDEVTVYISGCGWHTFTDYGDLYIEDYDSLGDLYLEVYPCGIYIYSPYAVWKVTGSGTAVSASTITTSYTLSNGLVIYETDGTYAIYYTYDYDGSLISFHYDNDISDATPGQEYFYVYNLQGDVIKIIDALGQIVIEYHYDGYGNIINDIESNPFYYINHYTYRGYRYDDEIGLFYCNARYYQPTIGRWLNADSVHYLDPMSTNGLNLFAYCMNNPVMLSDSSGCSPWWSWLISGIQVLGGIALCLVPGGQGIGVSLIIGGTLGLIANAAAPAIGQAIGGAGSIANGWGAFSTGMSILGLGIPGLIGGLALMAVGGATMAFGANEIVAAATGTNYIQEWTGMSDTAYGWTYLGLNAASSLGQIAGNAYRLHQTRTTRIGRAGELDGYRYYDKKGNPLYDFDHPHGNINFNHYHGWAGPGLTGRTSGQHWSYLRLIWWMLSGG